MSINWVMKAPGNDEFVKLPSERILYTSPPRTSLQISTPNNFPGTQPFKVNSEAGIVFITNQRIVYLPSAPTEELQSFSTPILNLQDTYVRAPFFGANYWTALCKPVPQGGIPANHPAVELRITFKEGGAFDFSSLYERLKERTLHALSVAEEAGDGMRGVNLADVHLEQLPAYEGRQDHEPARASQPEIHSPVPIRPMEHPPIARETSNEGPTAASSTDQQFVPPDEPPPGYEEAQADGAGR